jgi:hypothetical protein
MSNALAIAAVTATLQSILQHGIRNVPHLDDLTVTVLPLDKARGNNANNQLNLFLYQITRNAAYANSDMPRQVQPGETGVPPLPLNFYYLLTAFGKDDDTAMVPFGHKLLGMAMSILHDHPVLSAEDIINATTNSPAATGSNLDRQLERIRLTFLPQSLEDISKLWTGLATQYRLSAAYEASVALIESTRAARTPLPVLTRGRNDRGIFSHPDLTPPFPALTELVVPNKQPSAKLNDQLTLKGHHLAGTNIAALFNHPLWATPIEVHPDQGGTAAQVNVTVGNDPVKWPAGFYTVAVLVQPPDDPFRRSTNQLPFSLAPSMTIAPSSAPAGNITYTVTCSPEVRPEQRATLLLGDREIQANPHGAATNTLTFAATSVPAGAYFVRLRVDGVDSLLVNRAVVPPAFDQMQRVRVT